MRVTIDSIRVYDKGEGFCSLCIDAETPGSPETLDVPAALRSIADHIEEKRAAAKDQ